jgi:hypothetical protein
MSQSTQRKGILVDVRRFLQQIDDKVAAANVMGQVAELLVAQRVVAHVVDQRPAVGKCVRLL